MPLNSLATKTVAVSAVTFLLLGCGVLGKDKGGSGLVPGPFSLNDSERKHFDAWKQSLVKDCSTAQAFEGKTGSENRWIDLALFLGKTGNSLALHDGDAFTIFGDPNSPLGTSVAELNRNVSVNGASSEFGARMKRDGARCVVEVNGEKVHETYLVTSIPVIAAGAGVVKAPVKSQHIIQTSDDGVLDHGLIASLNQASIQKDAVTRQLKALLPEWSDEDLAAFFPVGGSSVLSAPHAAEIAGMYISAFSPQIPRSLANWQDFSDTLGQVTYTLSIPPNRLDYPGAENIADQGLWQIEVTVAWQASDALSNGRTYGNYEVKKLRWLEPIDFDDGRVTGCVLNRYKAFAQTQIHGTGSFAPSFGGSVGPCDALAADGTFSRILYEAPATKNLIVKKFDGVSGGDLERFLGWNVGLEHLAKAALAAGSDISAALDPGGFSPLIGQLSTYAVAVATASKAHEATKAKSDDYVTALAFPWAFRGHAVTADTVSAIIAGIANMLDPFEASVNQWMYELVSDPASQKAQIAYAQSVDDSIKAEVKALRVIADDLNLQGAFDSSKLQTVIQDQVELGAASQKWRATLTALTAFRARDKERAGDQSDFMFSSDFNDLAVVALKEDWSESDVRVTEMIAAFTSKDSFCRSRTSVSAQVNCAGRDLFSKGEGKFLSPSFGDRYGNLANDFVTLYDRLGTGFVFLRGDIQRDFWKPIWKACDNSQFRANSARLKSLVDQLLAADGLSRFDIERSIDELLDDCD